METVHVKASREYDVVISRGIIDEAGAYAKTVLKSRTVCIVSDDIVYSIYGKRVTESFERAGFKVESFVFPNGEQSKSMETYENLLEHLLSLKLTRSDALIALGGGVVGDLTGFAAATYQRGIPFIQIPTTLLAMVDSSVGGKTAVNLKSGKNQVGAFYQPYIVICDPDTLSTLSKEQFLCGCAEVIKYAVLGSEEFFNQLKDKPVWEQLENVIAKCVAMKRDVVAEDEFDTGKRMVLNLGHTVGHAVEACSSFGILHGQGVAIGMAVISRAAVEKGVLFGDDCERIIGILEQYELPTETEYSAESLYSGALADKKSDGGNITIVVPERIGSCRFIKIPKTELLDWISVGLK